MRWCIIVAFMGRWSAAIIIGSVTTRRRLFKERALFARVGGLDEKGRRVAFLFPACEDGLLFKTPQLLDDSFFVLARTGAKRLQVFKKIGTHVVVCERMKWYYLFKKGQKIVWMHVCMCVCVSACRNRKDWEGLVELNYLGRAREFWRPAICCHLKLRLVT